MSKQAAVEVFNGVNLDSWQNAMRAKLAKKGLWHLIPDPTGQYDWENMEETPETAARRARAQELHMKAVGHILESLSDAIQLSDTVRDCWNAKTLWERLEKAYSTHTKEFVLIVQMQLEALKFTSGGANMKAEDMTSFLMNFEGLISKYQAASGATMEFEGKMRYLFFKLPAPYHTVWKAMQDFEENRKMINQTREELRKSSIARTTRLEEIVKQQIAQLSPQGATPSSIGGILSTMTDSTSNALSMMAAAYTAAHAEDLIIPSKVDEGNSDTEKWIRLKNSLIKRHHELVIQRESRGEKRHETQNVSESGKHHAGFAAGGGHHKGAPRKFNPGHKKDNKKNYGNAVKGESSASGGVRDYSQIICHKCQLPGHVKKYCPENDNQDRNLGGEGRKQKAGVSGPRPFKFSGMATTLSAGLGNELDRSSALLMDSGCTIKMVAYKWQLHDYVAVKPFDIGTADQSGKPLTAIGKGTLRIRIKDREGVEKSDHDYLITDVAHVPNTAANLISVGSLRDQAGIATCFTKSKLGADVNCELRIMNNESKIIGVGISVPRNPTLSKLEAEIVRSNDSPTTETGLAAAPLTPEPTGLVRAFHPELVDSDDDEGASNEWEVEPLEISHDGDGKQGVAVDATLRSSRRDASNQARTLGEWHRTLVHVGEAKIKETEKQTIGMKIINPSDKSELKKCIPCHEMKATKVPMSNTSSARENRKFLDAVIVDLIGPYPSSIHPTSHYGIIFMEAKIGYAMGFTIRTKGATLQPLKDVCELINNQQNGRQMKQLIADGGGELYNNSSMKEECKRRGIIFEPTSPHTPEQHGMVERMNRTIKEKIGILLRESGLPAGMWSEAFQTAIYLTNRTASPGRDKTPYEEWTGRKPNLSVLHPFGCLAFVKVLGRKPNGKNNFDPKAVPGVLVGYESFTYRIFMPQKKSVVRSRHVTFIDDTKGYQYFIDLESGKTPNMGNLPEIFPQESELLRVNETESEDDSDEETYQALKETSEENVINRGEMEIAQERNEQPPINPASVIQQIQEELQGDINAHELANQIEEDIAVIRPITSLEELPQPSEPIIQPTIPEEVQRELPQSTAVMPKTAKKRSVKAAPPADGPASNTRSRTKPVTPATTGTVGGLMRPTASSSLRTNAATKQPIRKVIPKGKAMTGIAIGTESITDDETPYKMNFTTENDSPTLEDALSGSDRQKWIEAMETEYESQIKNKTWELVPLESVPSDRRTVKCKWVLKIKRDQHGKISKYKARLVAKGFTQVANMDFFETYAPVCTFATMRLLLAIAVEMELNVAQFDVETAFLNGELKEEVFMEQPYGFISEGNKKQVCRLRKGIYGLKQAARIWNEKFDTVAKQFGFKKSDSDECLYVFFRGDDYALLTIYVDDIIVAAKRNQFSKSFLIFFNRHMKLEEKGQATWILGWHIQWEHDGSGLSISQSRHIKDAAEKFGIGGLYRTVSRPMEASAVTVLDNTEERKDVPYSSIIGSLLWIVNSRPDVAFSVGFLGRFQQHPTSGRWEQAKRVLRYLRDTQEEKLIYRRENSSNIRLECYVDADWASDINGRKSTGGFIFFLNGKAIHWKAKKQQTVALSSTEAEYLSLSDAVRTAIWLANLIRETGFEVRPIKIYEDNNGCIELTKGQGSQRTKHIDVRHHFIREHIENGDITVEYVNTEEQLADLMTKPLDASRMERLKNKIGIVKTE